MSNRALNLIKRTTFEKNLESCLVRQCGKFATRKEIRAAKRASIAISDKRFMNLYQIILK